MCGVCGLVRTDGAPIDPRQLEQMNAALRHRGPDSDGFYYHHEENGPAVGLAMRRLAIIDLQTGDQPMTNEDGSLWIVFNGEAYNFPELRRGLEQRGHRFRTKTDVECVLHLYEDFGDECVQHLRGMFAFALWDLPRRRLLVARDRLGKKPLYYTRQAGLFAFSSELPSLLCALPQTPPIHLAAIDHYLSLQYIPEPLTPYEGIFKLPAAHRLVLEADEMRIERYWQLSYLPKLTGTEADLEEELRQRLREAVQLRLISDVPLGAHLSGGIDSSIVVALMAESSTQPVKTFSVGFEETSFSELPYARQVAERFGADHHEFVCTFGDIPATLGDLAHHLGEPFADPSALPLYHLARLTRQHVTVALNGDGGDEAFAGYPRYWLDPLANRYLQLPDLVTRRLVPDLVRRIPDRSDGPVGSSLANGLKRLAALPDIDPRASLLRWGSYFHPAQKARLWREPYRSELDLRRCEAYLVEHFTAAPADSYVDHTLYADNNTYLPGDLLLKADRMLMAHSVEGRSPFLDHEFAAWAARLPERLKVRGRRGKYLLRKAFAAHLPPGLLQRGKQGFGIPVGAWFRGPLAAWADELLLDPSGPLDDWFSRSERETLLAEHRDGRADHGKRIYTLVMLKIWTQTL